MSKTTLYFNTRYRLDGEWDSSIEFKPDGKYGSIVQVEFKDGTEKMYHNVTKVHWRYNDGEKVAIESDIHGDGLTIKIDDINSLLALPSIYKMKTMYEPTEIDTE